MCIDAFVALPAPDKLPGRKCTFGKRGFASAHDAWRGLITWITAQLIMAQASAQRLNGAGLNWARDVSPGIAPCHVEDFLIEDANWSIHDLIVDTKNWWPEKKVLISPRWIREINWTDNLVNLNVDREKVKDSPIYDVPKLDRALHETFP
jgi:hypothetical protein